MQCLGFSYGGNFGNSRGHRSVVDHQLPKLNVAGSTPAARSDADIRFHRVADMVHEGICANCGEDSKAEVIDGPVARWTTWSCKHCGYQLQEHFRKF